jgi:hypothetical protein
VYPEKTDAEVARDILMRGAPIAAASVVHLAAHARAENVRLAAARYVVDGILGGGFNFGINVDDNLLALVTQLADNDIAREIVEGGPIA